jgi:predicted transcriptional regulator of viral defense system
MARYATLNRLAQIAQDQWGLVTRRQAERAGVSPATLQRLASESVLERVAQGAYHLTAAPTPDHLELRAAWLQLAPDVPAWERTPRQGVVSHRSAAALYGLGHLPADRHEFTLPVRRQSRREDVRLHQREVTDSGWITLRGLPVTRPARIAADLLADREDPEAVGHVIADAIRGVHDYPGTFADALAPHAAKFGLRRHDGIALLGWLLDLVGDPETPEWIADARAHLQRSPVA